MGRFWRRALTLTGALGILVATASPAASAPDDVQWDPTLPKLISSGAPGDPVAIANASLQASQLATQTTLDLGRRFHLHRPSGVISSSTVPAALSMWRSIWVTARYSRKPAATGRSASIHFEPRECRRISLASSNIEPDGQLPIAVGRLLTQTRHLSLIRITRRGYLDRLLRSTPQHQIHPYCAGEHRRTDDDRRRVQIEHQRSGRCT